MLNMNQIRYCAEECERQRTGPLMVPNMIEAYHHAVTMRNMYGTGLTETYILVLGQLVEPAKNRTGFRLGPAIFAGGGQALPAEQINRKLHDLCEGWNAGLISPHELYQEFETIHPFRDGNGRVGAILWNMSCGTLDMPTVAPEYERQ